MTIRRALLPLLILGLCFSGLCFGQTDWKTATHLPGVDLSGLTPAQRQIALSVLRSESCTCGCNYKLAECRVVDPQCATSRRYADLIVRLASAGKSEKEVRAAVIKLASQAPPLLSDPVKLSIEGDPMRGPANAKVTIIEFSDFQ